MKRPKRHRVKLKPSGPDLAKTVLQTGPQSLQRATTKQPDEVITYEDYVKEREHLSKYESDNWEHFEKQLLTLASAFLAFSLSFLALFDTPNKPTWHSVLVACWICFAGSILCVLLSFPVNAVGNRAELVVLEKMLEREEPSPELNGWSVIGYLLYGIAGLAFLSGLILLVVFCAHNVYIF